MTQCVIIKIFLKMAKASFNPEKSWYDGGNQTRHPPQKGTVIA